MRKINTTTTDSTLTRVLRLGLSATIFTKYRKNSDLHKAKEKQEQYLTSEEVYYEIITGPRVGSPYQDN